ncbi:acyltransferase [Dyadobacter sp. CY326]|uniref:acyltransferase n=1 Tax=Dyadobacter sp. CY326 TaxID=2907300 RepID=UPI001F2C1AFF|nr:acyltransferase [Dyadobacter sp. CY326]MCE7066129.1 acyltransferase [Dyadobacter sp. CY326]
MRRFLSEFRLYLCNRWVCFIPSHTIRLGFYKRVMQFEIGEGSNIFLGCTFDCAGSLQIGRNSVINANCRIDNRGGISIGQNVSISNDVIILTADHDMETLDLQGRTRAVVIQDYVWIGTRAMIMPGIVIGKGAIVAAGAIATKNVNPFDVVGGIPAKVIKRRPESETYPYNASFKRLFQ